jgi:hypothetical protein
MRGFSRSGGTAGRIDDAAALSASLLSDIVRTGWLQSVE